MDIQSQKAELWPYFLSHLRFLLGPSNSAGQRHWSSVREFQNKCPLFLEAEGGRGRPERVSLLNLRVPKSIPTTLSVHLSISTSLCVSPSLKLFLGLFTSISVYVSPSLHLSASFHLYIFLPLSLSMSPCISIAQLPYPSMCFCTFISLTVFPAFSLYSSFSLLLIPLCTEKTKLFTSREHLSRRATLLVKVKQDFDAENYVYGATSVTECSNTARADKV